MKKQTLLFMTAILTACAASTPQDARDMGADRRYVFEVGADYQTAYRRILETARNCYQGWVLTATMTVNGDLFPDTHSGTITVGLYGGLGASLYQVIDVRGLDGTRTQITAAFPMGPVEKQGLKVKAWANATGAAC